MKKKLNTAEIIQIIFCGAGILLMTAPLFLENGRDYLQLALALNGVGLVTFLYNENQKKKKA